MLTLFKFLHEKIEIFQDHEHAFPVFIFVQKVDEINIIYQALQSYPKSTKIDAFGQKIYTLCHNFT